MSYEWIGKHFSVYFLLVFSSFSRLEKQKGYFIETKGFFCFSLNKKVAEKATSKLNVFACTFFLENEEKTNEKNPEKCFCINLQLTCRKLGKCEQRKRKQPKLQHRLVMSQPSPSIGTTGHFDRKKLLLIFSKHFQHSLIHMGRSRKFRRKQAKIMLREQYLHAHNTTQNIVDYKAFFEILEKGVQPPLCPS